METAGQSFQNSREKFTNYNEELGEKQKEFFFTCLAREYFVLFVCVKIMQIYASLTCSGVAEQGGGRLGGSKAAGAVDGAGGAGPLFVGTGLKLPPRPIEPLRRGTPDVGKESTDFLGATAPDVDAVVDPPSEALALLSISSIYIHTRRRSGDKRGKKKWVEKKDRKIKVRKRLYRINDRS